MVSDEGTIHMVERDGVFWPLAPADVRQQVRDRAHVVERRHGFARLVLAVVVQALFWTPVWVAVGTFGSGAGSLADMAPLDWAMLAAAVAIGVYVVPRITSRADEGPSVAERLAHERGYLLYSTTELPE